MCRTSHLANTRTIMVLYSILYVDDEPDLLLLGKTFLEKQGDVAIDTRESATDGLTALRQKSYDAVISDYQMPVMDGLAFLKTVRAEFGNLPFILFTGRGREDVVIEAINSGADFYLQKGGDVRSQFAELFHKINMAVGRKRALDSLHISEQRLSTLFHASPIHQMITDFSSGRILDINDRYLKDLNISRTDAVGKTPEEIGLVLDPHQFSSIRQQLDQQGMVRNAELLVRVPDGRTFTTLASMTLVHVPGQDLVYTQSMDISMRKKAQQTIDALLNAPPDVSMLLDTRGTILAVNQAASERFHVPAGSLVGKNAYTLISSELEDLRIESIEEAARTKTPLIFIDNRAGRVYENHVYPEIGPDGGVTSLAVYSRDVTDERQAKEALRTSEEKYRLVVENSHDTIYIHRDNRFLFINRQAEVLTGFSHDELMKREIWDFIHPDDRKRLKEASLRRFAGGHLSSEFCARILTKSGEVRDGEFFVDIVEFLGRPAILGIARDITERKRSEEAIREREEQLRLLADNLPLGMVYQVVRDPDGKQRFVQVSAGVEVIHELSPDAVLKDPALLYNQIVPEELRRVQESEEHSHQTMTPFSIETRIRTPSGMERWVLLRSAPRLLPGGGTLWDGIELDITAAKQAEEELKAAYEELTASQEELHSQIEQLRESQEQNAESEELHRRMIATIPDIVVRTDAEGKIIYINDIGVKMSGFGSADDLIGKSMLSFIAPECLEEAVLNTRLMFEGPLGPKEYTLMVKDGVRYRFEVNGDVLRSAEGTPYGLIYLCRDITERTRGEEALRRSEENYRLIIENMQDVFYRVNREGIITMISPYGARLVGYDSPSDLIGKMKATEFYADAAERDLFLAYLREKKVVTGYPLTLKDRQGNIHFATASCRLIYDTGGNFNGIEGVLHDITHLKEVENALRQANRQITLMTSITRHDIHNQLMVLGGWLELSRASVADPDAMLELITKEQKVVDVIAQQISFTTIIDDMGAKAPLWQDPVHLIELSKVSLPFGTIRLEVDITEIEIFADLLFGKVVYNLFDNALRYGGEKMSVIRVYTKLEKESLLLIVEDDGVGIPARDKTRLFERGYGKNTGLGLFLVREILLITGITIKESGSPGKGARFEMRVPEKAFRYKNGNPCQDPCPFPSS
ncbi:MAG: PAS domain S-box protein [Methanoregula sp.]